MQINEISLDWRPVLGYEEYYEVNSQAMIRSIRKKNYGFMLGQRIDRAGYVTVRLTKPNLKSSTRYVHRILAQAFIENPNNKCCVNHKNGQKKCNVIENLEWVTISENNKHARKLSLLKLKGFTDCDVCPPIALQTIKTAA